MESLVSLHTFIGTMNQFEKLRRSAMSIVANAFDPSTSSVGAPCL
jgi:hypothetical protein